MRIIKKPKGFVVKTKNKKQNKVQLPVLNYPHKLRYKVSNLNKNKPKKNLE